MVNNVRGEEADRRAKLFKICTVAVFDLSVFCFGQQVFVPACASGSEEVKLETHVNVPRISSHRRISFLGNLCYRESWYAVVSKAAHVHQVMVHCSLYCDIFYCEFESKEVASQMPQHVGDAADRFQYLHQGFQIYDSEHSFKC